MLSETKEIIHKHPMISLDYNKKRLKNEKKNNVFFSWFAKSKKSEGKRIFEKKRKRIDLSSAISL